MVGVVGGAEPPLPPNYHEPNLLPGPAPLADSVAEAEMVRQLRAQLDRSIAGRRRAERIMSESRRQLLEERERAAEEHHITLALRDAILPGPGGSIDLPHARIAVRYVPAEKAASLGGDWYEATTVPDGRVLLAVGDVSGHGLAAIAQMAQLRHGLKGLAMTGASPDRLLAWLNHLVLSRPDDTTATVVIGYFDPATGLFVWAQAGHLAPVLVRKAVAHQLGSPPGVVLGVAPNLPYTVAEIRLLPDDLLLMFTDGLVERRGRDIDEGLALTLTAAEAINGHNDLGACLDLLIDAIGGPNPEDDTCLLAVRVREAGQ